MLKVMLKHLIISFSKSKFLQFFIFLFDFNFIFILHFLFFNIAFDDVELYIFSNYFDELRPIFVHFSNLE